MTIHDNKRYIFIHNPRTAGSSIYKCLVRDGARHDGLHEYSSHIEQMKNWANYFSFTFVRNPYSRVASWWAWLKREFENGRGWVIDPGTFEEFVLEKRSVRGNNRGWWLIWQPQYELLAIDNVKYDFIGRHESLIADFDYICKRIGIDYKLGHFKKTGVNYKAIHTEKTKSIIAEHFKVDLEYFNYDFNP